MIYDATRFNREPYSTRELKQMGGTSLTLLLNLMKLFDIRLGTAQIHIFLFGAHNIGRAARLGEGRGGGGSGAVYLLSTTAGRGCNVVIESSHEKLPAPKGGTSRNTLKGGKGGLSLSEIVGQNEPPVRSPLLVRATAIEDSCSPSAPSQWQVCDLLNNNNNYTPLTSL